MKINLYNNKYLVGFMLLVFIMPACFLRIPIALSIYRYLGFACMFLLLLFVIKGKKISPPFLWIYGFHAVILLATLINRGDLWLFFCDNYASFSLCILFALMLEKNPKILISASKVLDILVYINLLTMLIYPKGMYIVANGAHWFLGHKNILSRIMLPIICLALIRAYYCFGKIKLNTIVLLASASLTIILANSTTALIGFAVFALFLFLFHNKTKRLPRFFTLFSALCVTVIIFFALLFFNFQKYFSFLIELILGKDLTLTNRLAVWQMALQKISHKFFEGYGYLSGNQFIEMFGRDTYTHPHNYFLYIFMTGGIVLSVIVFMGYFYANKTLKNSIDTVYSKIIMFTLIAFLIMGLTEALTSTVFLYPLLILAMNADKLKSNRLTAPIRTDSTI
ncbi:MAG: O-antigen ligase family protein [Ruminococcus sp.]|nr:O-antigen ligase family protein [Ruminococcus sp.]